MDATSISYVLYENENKKVVQRVYNIIQKQIIDLNTENKRGCVDVVYIAAKLENSTISLTNKPF